MNRPKSMPVKRMEEAASRITAAWILLLLLLMSLASITQSASTTAVTTARHNTQSRVSHLLHRGGDNRPVADSARPIVEGLKNFLASGLAAVCAKTALAPFDTIKTVQQEHRSLIGGSLKFADAAKTVMARGNGFVELYAGLGVAAVGSMPSVGLYFGIYSYSKRMMGPFLTTHFGNSSSDSNTLNDNSRLLRTLTIATSAAIGNTVASVSRVPYEVLKQKLQTNQYPSTLIAVRSMLSSPSGLRSFFPLGGISSQMVRDIPYAIVTLLTYEYLREHWVSNSKTAVSPWRDMASGAIAGGLGSYVTNPLDVIKTRLQSSSNSDYYKGVVDCARRTFAEEGSGAFLKGSVPRLIHKVPANAIFFFSYELFRRMLQVENTNVNTNMNNTTQNTDKQATKPR